MPTTQRPSLFLAARPSRAFLETLLVSVALWCGLLLFQPVISSFNLKLLLISFVSLCSILFFALRLRLSSAKWWRRCLSGGLLAFALSLALGAISLIGAFVLFGTSTADFTSRGGAAPFFVGIVPFLCWITLAFFRTMTYLLVSWNRLRRTQLLWALTHAHVLVVALAAGLFILLVEGAIFISSNRFTNFSLYYLIPTTLGLLFLGIIAMAAVVPPSALFSYLVMRRTTRRIKNLASATSILRSGNYTVRVPVTGQDEVAQLQADFNAMATELERAMQALRGERDTVAGLLQSRRELIANVSHELRTPMATLRSYLETTLTHWDDAPSPNARHDLQIMENEVVRLQSLVEDLFTLSRAEVGRLTLRCEPTDLAAVVQRVVTARAPLAWRVGRVEMATDTPPAIPPALVDPLRLEQVLHNLLHNAVRHTPPGGIVAVVATAEPDEVILHVKDTGEGIAPADLPHIWERFYQAQNTLSPVAGGSGLGLALVKEMVEAMDGSVAVESTPGVGSCFSLHLPQANVKNETTVLPPAKQNDQSTIASEKGKV